MPLTLDKLPRSCIKFLDRAISNPNPTFAKGEPRNSYLLRTQVTFLGHDRGSKPQKSAEFR